MALAEYEICLTCSVQITSAVYDEMADDYIALPCEHRAESGDLWV